MVKDPMRTPMSKFIALLRGINVGGHNLIAMSEVCDLFGDLGFGGAKSLLQSGNVVFECSGTDPAALERLLESETAEKIGVSVDYLIRSGKAWERIVARNPFPAEAENDPSRLVVMVLKSAPAAKNLGLLQCSIQGPEIVRADGKQLYVYYPDGMGRSKLSTTLIERKLETRGTARNWNTVLKLSALCQPGGAD
jgi:uncharacterized protein (DUF1697 family)